MNFKPRKNGPFKGPKARQNRKKMFGKKESKISQLDREIKTLTERYDQVDPTDCKTFKDFPLSQLTLQGLKASKFESPTDIQRESLLLALQGHDILGAAKTGSGKTLAFLVPVLECLFKNKWSKLDGLGALIISPTRELAYQTFEVLKMVGKFHNFSAGLVIGGKPLREEMGRINQTNIVICTPGRLLQHMDETAYFTADSLQMLVLDEADRILDMGFQQSMNAIIENLPSERQTLLFSATQTRSVKDLARLSLKDPMFVSVHENADKSTPNKLEQNYIVCELHDKISMIWSFLKMHLKSKILVFLSSCKQVKYITEAMNMLRPGIPLMCLHGGMPQLRRVATYNQFLWKQHACLFATDIAARGLDFPSINWVIQLDCPEDANTYIHRAGRTARFEKDGEALLVLLPSEEEEMVKQLQDKKIPIEKININQRRFFNIQNKMESNCASDVNLKESAQRAFVAYLKSVFLMHNKKVFDVHSLDVEAFARSLGLAVTPKLRFLKKDQQRLQEKEKQERTLKKLKSPEAEVSVTNSSSESESESGSENSSNSVNDSENEEEDKAKIDLDDAESGTEESGSDSGQQKTLKLGKDSESLNFNVDDSDDELFTVKRHVAIEELDKEELRADLDELKKNSKKFQKVKTKKQLADLLRKKNISINTKIKFGDEGEEDSGKMDDSSDEEGGGGGINIASAKKHMEKEDLADKEAYRQRVKKEHKEKRLKLKEERRKKRESRRMKEVSDDEEVEVKLPSDDDDDDDGADPLSFIPDPNKVYSGNQSDDSDSDSESEEDRPSPAKRRKVATTMSASSDSENDDANDTSDDEELDDVDDDDDDDDQSDDYDIKDTRQSLKSDEEIALMLLGGKR